MASTWGVETSKSSRSERWLSSSSAPSAAAADQRALLAGVDHPDLEVVGHRDVRALERVAVEDEGAARPSRDRGELVEDAAGDAGGPLLRELADAGDLDRVTRVSEGERDGHLERGGRRHAGADRDVGPDLAAEAEARADLGDHAGDVAGPAGLDRRRVGDVERHVRHPGGVGRREHDPVAAPASRHRDAHGGGEGQAPSARVVGVLADQVDPPRSEGAHGRGHGAEP